jgi:hypothetical protein
VIPARLSRAHRGSRGGLALAAGSALAITRSVMSPPTINNEARERILSIGR